MIVPKSYITRTSAFFATALKKEWAEGQARVIELSEETPELVAHYLDWVYTSALPTKTLRHTGDLTRRTCALELLAELYVLGERRLDSKFRNAIATEFVRLEPAKEHHSFCTSFRRDTFVKTIYQGTTVGSSARQLMVDQSLRVGCSRCNSGAFDESYL